VRLPDENVAWLDAEVAAGRFPSRTAGLAKLLTKAQRRQEDEADMLKILGNPDPDDESRQEWMRTRQYPPTDDLSYTDDQREVTVPDHAATEAVQDRSSSGTTLESGHTANATASASARPRRIAAEPGRTNRTTINK
jgi:Arc/MetJ-type ribon-helix-helix transcriptional regulator